MSYRIQHKFWLDVDRDDEAAINDEVVYLKKQRSFAATIRDGIRLICDLRAGRLGVLQELFPWVRDAISAEILPSRVGGGGFDDSATREQLERLERLLMGQNNGALMAGQGGPKPLSIAPRPPAVPDPDDNDTPLIVRPAVLPQGNSAESFLASAFALQ